MRHPVETVLTIIYQCYNLITKLEWSICAVLHQLAAHFIHSHVLLPTIYFNAESMLAPEKCENNNFLGLIANMATQHRSQQHQQQ